MDTIIQYLPYILDGIIIISFLSHTARGIKLGLIGSLAGLALTLTGMIFIHRYQGEIVSFIIDNAVHRHLCEFISERITEAIDTGTQSLTDSLPDLFAKAAKEADITSSSFSAGAISDISEKISVSAESLFIIPAVTGILYFLTYCLTSAINLSLTQPIGKIVNHIPIVGKVNRTLGGIFGAFKGIAAVFILVILLLAIIKFIPGSTLAASTEKTILLNKILETAEQYIH